MRLYCSTTPTAALIAFAASSDGVIMYSAVTRKAMRGTSLGTAECVTVKEAVKMMTYNGAYLSREQEIKGSLEPGKRADIAILDRSLDGIDPEDIRNIQVDMTILDGKIIYSRG